MSRRRIPKNKNVWWVKNLFKYAPSYLKIPSPPTHSQSFPAQALSLRFFLLLFAKRHLSYGTEYLFGEPAYFRNATHNVGHTQHNPIRLP